MTTREKEQDKKQDKTEAVVLSVDREGIENEIREVKNAVNLLNEIKEALKELEAGYTIEQIKQLGETKLSDKSINDYLNTIYNEYPKAIGDIARRIVKLKLKEIQERINRGYYTNYNFDLVEYKEDGTIVINTNAVDLLEEKHTYKLTTAKGIASYNKHKEICKMFEELIKEVQPYNKEFERFTIFDKFFHHYMEGDEIKISINDSIYAINYE